GPGERRHARGRTHTCCGCPAESRSSPQPSPAPGRRPNARRVRVVCSCERTAFLATHAGLLIGRHRARNPSPPPHTNLTNAQCPHAPPWPSCFSLPGLSSAQQSSGPLTMGSRHVMTHREAASVEVWWCRARSTALSGPPLGSWTVAVVL